MLELHPNSALLCSRVGFIYLTLNSTAQAVRFLERACSLNPADWNSHLALAEVLIKQGRHEAAIARYQQTLQLEPSCSPALVGMAECCKELYRFEEAISYFQKAKAADPKDFKAVCQLGVLCVQLGGLDLGIESLQRAANSILRMSKSTPTWLRPTNKKVTWGRPPSFMPRRSPSIPRLFCGLQPGIDPSLPGRIDEAATAFGTAASLRPNDSQYQYQLARATIELGAHAKLSRPPAKPSHSILTTKKSSWSALTPALSASTTMRRWRRPRQPSTSIPKTSRQFYIWRKPSLSWVKPRKPKPVFTTPSVWPLCTARPSAGWAWSICAVAMPKRPPSIFSRPSKSNPTTRPVSAIWDYFI